MAMVCNFCGKKELADHPGEVLKEGICDDCLLHHFPHLYELIKGILGVKRMEDSYKPHIGAPK